MAELNPWYVTGFCDGEAAFTYSRNGGAFSVYFGLTQREDNKELIENIHEYFNYVGTIYKRIETLPTKNSGHTKPSVYYRTSRVDELPTIINHFDKYPLQSKRKFEAYKIWRDMAMHKIENYRHTDYDTLRALAEKLSKFNSKSSAFNVHSR